MNRIQVIEITLLVLTGLLESVAQDAASRRIDFAHDVSPILKTHCVECHGGTQSKGGFSLNTRELLLDAEAVVLNRPNQSRLIELVTSDDPNEQMPPKGRQRLQEAEIKILKTWIKQGVNWENGFTFAPNSYEPPLKHRRLKLPAASNTSRDNPIDRIVDAYYQKQKVSIPEVVSDRQFLRRLHLDVVGQLPSLRLQTQFLADTNSAKRETWVQKLLINNDGSTDELDIAYAEHWLTFWNDLLRNTYTGTGFITGGRKRITPWLYQSLVENKPYNKFVHELVAPTPESDGFITGIRWRGEVNSSQTPEIQFAQNITQAFLGINMKCASCHDSFIDRWTLEETYSLAAVYSKSPLELHRCDKPLGRRATAAWIFPELGQIDKDAPQGERLKQLADLMVHPDNGRLTRTIVNRIWHRLMGRGIVHPVDAMHTAPWNEDLLDYLAIYLVDQNYDLKKLIALICSSKAYQSVSDRNDKQTNEGEFVFRGPFAKRLTAEQFVDAVWTLTGDAPKSFDAKIKRPEMPDAAPIPVRASLVKNDELMKSLGRPNRDQIVTSRPSTLTTLEAIDLANGQRLFKWIQSGGRNAVAKHADVDSFIVWLYAAALTRPASPNELEFARNVIGETLTQESAEDLIWSIVMLPEFQFVR